MRLQDCDLPGKHLLRSTGQVAVAVAGPPAVDEPEAVSLKEALGIYLRLKGKGKSKTFRRSAERSCEYVIEVCGDKPINDYTKPEANAFRDALVERGLAGTSITRTVGSVRSIINFAANETGIEFNNPFTTILGTILGALFLGIVKNALPVVDVSPFWQMAISGAAIITAVAFNARSAKAKGRIILRRAQAHGAQA